ncbi:uncharacterized protein DUF1836 [Streptohalobacillus salinus]|uniref:Uncharacterized protein DUF1836 n=1 Tax=Streptohalobacillus salinus TaxID=621096 RepID=A0A2V3WTP7_9BACI|nr:DUF1836 domain-containing protein [Streptohalobacillus salinus]PXW92181.1 uncharacterized protein DUF1836 [Streptohalobacillus salinus]
MTQHLKDLHVHGIVEKDKIPSLDLYMDQVTQLFDQTYQKVKRDESEKILTKTMINNYAKGKLLFPIENKKYSSDQIMLIQMIYQLKGALSIQDIKQTLDPLKTAVHEEALDFDAVYQDYTQLLEMQSRDFTDDLDRIEASVEALTEDPVLTNVYTLSALVQMSHMYRRVAERLVDHLNQPGQDKSVPKEK